MREPSCVLNHNAMRKELRDKGIISPQKCPNCGWILSPLKDDDNDEDEPAIESRLQAIEDFLDMKFGEWK